MIIKFKTYSMGSKGMRALKRVLQERGHNVKTLRKTNSRYRYNSSHYVINWGSSSYTNMPVLNKPSSIGISSDKYKTFATLYQNEELQRYLPKFTQSRQIAEQWINEGFKVYCRTLLSSREGRGIVVATNVEDIVRAPLYVRGIQSISREIRVHVFRGYAIDFTQKKKMAPERLQEEGITVNPDVKNHGNGYVFARQEIRIPQLAKDIAIQCVNQLGLDFGAADIILAEENGVEIPYLIEVNTSPGITMTTLEKYADAIEVWGGVRDPYIERSVMEEVVEEPEPIEEEQVEEESEIEDEVVEEVEEEPVFEEDDFSRRMRLNLNRYKSNSNMRSM